MFSLGSLLVLLTVVVWGEGALLRDDTSRTHGRQWRIFIYPATMLAKALSGALPRCCSRGSSARIAVASPSTVGKRVSLTPCCSSHCGFRGEWPSTTAHRTTLHSFLSLPHLHTRILVACAVTGRTTSWGTSWIVWQGRRRPTRAKQSRPRTWLPPLRGKRLRLEPPPPPPHPEACPRNASSW